ncbi:hypothetical protein QBZ16_002921 [Prototheca wickerhamii]|uniref:carnosine N-methyltransferase n=1 Tax=Prototheca wickerhamii TaxID=3111 RepID=A0AAD9ML68_PROWI|nr:hypothetical protein QBZ16_002921 [Prototheca wickerhamii]
MQNGQALESMVKQFLVEPLLNNASSTRGALSMVAGDFLEVFQRSEYRGAFDCVATCFFIDTAHNVVAYMETIAAILKPGGLWINLGPLLYHWAEPNELPNEPNVELPLEDVLDVAQRLGFVLEEHETA